MAQRSVFGMGLIGALMLMLGSGPVQAQQDSPIPPRRVILAADTDLPGGDLGKIFDTTLQGCIGACLANADCTALTYNQRARACFPKGVGAATPIPFTGALSGWVQDADAAQTAQAAARAAALPAASGEDLTAARTQAQTMAAQNLPSAEIDPVDRAAQAEAAGDMDAAARLIAQMLAQDDSAQRWTDLSRVTLTASGGDAGAAALMALNGYLRAPDDGTAARALQALAPAWERIGRGRDALKAARLAAQLAPDDPSVAEQLSQLQERYGFRVTDTQIESDGPTPRFCAYLSEPLSSGVDYAPFVRLPGPGLAVEATDSQLCVTGVTHGQEVRLTLRAGLPSAEGETLDKDTAVAGYVRDRTPAVRFPGRSYVLPAGGDQGLAMVTVNIDTVDLRLLRLSDRNLIRTMTEGMFATPLDAWRASYFSDSMATEVWRGQADVAKPLGQDTTNAELTTRLAVPQAAGPLTPGIYILQASVAVEQADERPVAAQWFVISDFGISTLAGTDGLTVAVRGLQDAAAKQGVEVALVSRANDVLGRASTDDDGIARFPAGLTRGDGAAAPALVTVVDWQGDGADRTLRDMAFLSLTDPEFDLSDRGVEGQPPAPPIDVFATTDRGAYRAGETVNATILTRDAGARAIPGLPLTAVIFRPDGVEQTRLTPDSAGAGGFTLSWTLPGNAPRGGWRVDLRAEADGPALAQMPFLVEDFLPERIDFALTLPERPAQAGGTLAFSLDARWLFGAPAADLPVDGRIRYAAARDLPGFDGFAFGLHDDPARPRSDSLPSGTTDAQGHYAADIDIPDATALGTRAMRATLALELREGAGRPVERTADRLILPDTPVIGIKPMFDGGAVPENAEARFQIVAVGPDFAPAAVPVRWVLNRVDTTYQWYSIGGQWNWEPITRRSKVTEGVAQTGAAPVEIASPVDWGSYELIAEPASDAGGGASVTFSAGWGAEAVAGSETPDRLTVTLDQPAYRAGDTAHVTVDALADGTGIVSVLSNRVVALRMVALKQGVNSIDLPVTDDWGAGVYVAVSAIRPLAGAEPDDRRPVRALGLSHAAVDPGDRKLDASLEAPAKARPRGTIPVVLTVAGATPGDTVNATIAAVDQGILNLTGFSPPDPSDHYFGQRRLGVALRDLYGRLILPTGAPDGAIREGGDAALAMNSEAPPPTEALMSWFSGPLTVGDDGKVRVDVPVGDFNGELRVMAVVWSARAVGQADASVTVNDPVVVTVTAPRFLAPGDAAQIGLLLTNADGPAGQVTVALSDTGGVPVSPGSPAQPVILGENAEARLIVPISAGDRSGIARLHLTATLPDGSEVTKDIVIPVALNEPQVIRQDRLTLAPGASATVPATLTAGLMPGVAVTAAVGDFALLDVAAQLSRLARYPYGCTEQLASIAMPMLYLPDLADLSGGRGDQDAPQSVDKAIAQILTRQGSGGGFGLWSAGSGDQWLDAYITDFLSRARAAGHAVPDVPFRAAIAHLQTAANTATDPQAGSADDNAALAYALAVLARERAATVGDLRYYADTAAAAFTTPMSSALLGAALASYGDQPRADRMFTQAMAQVRRDLGTSEPAAFRADYGTHLRDAAAVLALAADAGSQVVDRGELASAVAEGAAQRGDLTSTQEAVWTVLAANALARDQDTGVMLNGAQMIAAVTALPDPGSDVIANAGNQPTELRLTALGQPATAPQAAGNGYTISRRYYSIDGQSLDPATVAQGTRMVAVIEVQPLDEGGGRLIVTDPLPAGFEIDNPHLLREGDVSTLDWLAGETDPEMAEFRQDRFTAALTWTDMQPFRLAYIVRAVTPGEFRHPAASVEDMYRPSRRAWTAGGHVTVTR